MKKKNSAFRTLTFKEYLESTVGPAVVGGEEQVQEVAAAEQELRHLGSIERANQRREQVGAVVHFQEVVAQLRLKPDNIEIRGREAEEAIFIKTLRMLRLRRQFSPRRTYSDFMEVNEKNLLPPHPPSITLQLKCLNIVTCTFGFGFVVYIYWCVSTVDQICSAFLINGFLLLCSGPM